MNVQPTEPNAGLFAAAGLVERHRTWQVARKHRRRRDPNFPGDRVDWIFASPDVAFSAFEIYPSAASDHLPLIVAVTIG